MFIIFKLLFFIGMKKNLIIILKSFKRLKNNLKISLLKQTLLSKLNFIAKDLNYIYFVRMN